MWVGPSKHFSHFEGEVGEGGVKGCSWVAPFQVSPRKGCTLSLLCVLLPLPLWTDNPTTAPLQPPPP